LISQKLLDKFPAGRHIHHHPHFQLLLMYSASYQMECDLMVGSVGIVTLLLLVVCWRRDTCFRFILKKISDSQNESSFRVDSWASSSPWYGSSCSGRKVEAVVFSVGSKNRDCMVCSHVDFWNFLIIGIENIRLSHHRLPLRCCQCCCWEMYLSHVTITSSNVTVISDISWGRIRHDRLQGPGDMVTNVSCGGRRGGWMSSNSRSVSVDCW